MSDGWNSKSESRGGKVSLPMPDTKEGQDESAEVRNSGPQWGHGDFKEGSWDPSTSFANPKGSGWDSKSEDTKPDNKGHLK